jgi:hypothetical protein
MGDLGHGQFVVIVRCGRDKLRAVIDRRLEAPVLPRPEDFWS